MTIRREGESEHRRMLDQSGRACRSSQCGNFSDWGALRALNTQHTYAAGPVKVHEGKHKLRAQLGGYYGSCVSAGLLICCAFRYPLARFCSWVTSPHNSLRVKQVWYVPSYLSSKRVGHDEPVWSVVQALVVSYPRFGCKGGAVHWNRCVDYGVASPKRRWHQGEAGVAGSARC
jgi:hypothetical protein